MKNSNLLLFAIFVITIYGCEKSAVSAITDVNSLESQPLDANTVTNEIIISDATLENAQFPDAAGDFEIQLGESDNVAFQIAGFTLPFSSSRPIATVLLRIKSVDNEKADQFFNIPESSLGLTSEEKKESGNREKNLVEEYEIKIQFGKTLTAGTFCYEIVAVDVNGNLSIIPTKCIEIQSWGGLPDLIGQWYYSHKIEDGVVVDTTQFSCRNYGEYCGAELKVNCEKIHSYDTYFSSEGTYNRTWNYTSNFHVTNVDHDGNCEMGEFRENTSTRLIEGNWAYDEKNDAFYLVMFRRVHNGREEIFERGRISKRAFILMSDEFRFLSEHSSRTPKKIDQVYVR